MSWFTSRRDRAPTLADETVWAALFDEWARVEHRESSVRFQVGFLCDDRTEPCARNRLPLVQLVRTPETAIDFADDWTGFPGLDVVPDARRALTLWAADLLSIRHRDDWVYVIDPGRPFPPERLEVLAHATRMRRYGVVSAALSGPTETGSFRVADLTAATFTTLVRLEDRRRTVARRPGR